MAKKSTAGVFQLENGMWGFRFVTTVNSTRKDVRRTKDEQGNPFKSERAARKAKEEYLRQLSLESALPLSRRRVTIAEVYEEYCAKGRSGKAYGTIRKQDSLWNNHLRDRFGKRYISDISSSEINDYLSCQYYEEERAYKYVEAFLKMFYLIFGQAYSRNYLSVDRYNSLCVNKDSKIHMPKMKIDEDEDIVAFSAEEMKGLDAYFKGSNAETAYMLGKYCGLRIGECYGLLWSDVDFEQGTLSIERQMQYEDGVIRLVPLKTRSARRKIFLNSTLQAYLKELKLNIRS